MSGVIKLHDEKTLERAEETLQEWATIFADEGLDTDAAEALRVASVILKFRCGFSEGSKRP